MKTEMVKCHELVDGKKVFVAEANLEIAETVEDILKLNDAGLPDATIVSHFNASRRIELQRQLKAGGESKVTAKAKIAKVNKLFEVAKDNPALAAQLRELGLLD